MKRLILILKNWKRYKYWKIVKSGKKTTDYVRGVGYYISPLMLGYDPKGTIEEYKMESGKIGLYELLRVKRFSDPWDMVESSAWHFIGYKDEKPIKECSFEDFLTIYKP